MTATARKEVGDRAAGSHGRQERRRRSVPSGVYMESGVAGRVLVFLWSMAPWSQGPVAFVWPKLDTIAHALDLWPSQVGKALKKLRDVGWIRRETRKVRFDGRMVDRLGFVLLEEPSDGPLFDWIRREDEEGEVVVSTPPRVVTSPPPEVVVPSFEEQEPNRNSSSACAREPGEDEEEETPEQLPPAASVERELWDTAEQERHAQLGGDLPRPCNEVRRATVRRLVNHVRRDERCSEPEAVATVRSCVRARVAYARRKRAEGDHHYAALCYSDPFSVRAYEAVIAFERTKPQARSAEQARAAWMAREWTPDWDAPRPPEPELDPKIAAAMDAFFGSIRPPEAS